MPEVTEGIEFRYTYLELTYNDDVEKLRRKQKEGNRGRGERERKRTRGMKIGF